MSNFDQLIHCLESLSSNHDPQVQASARSFIETQLTTTSPLHIDITNYLVQKEVETRHKILVITSIKSLFSKEVRNPNQSSIQRYSELLNLYIPCYFFLPNERVLMLNFIDVLISLFLLVGDSNIVFSHIKEYLSNTATYDKYIMIKVLLFIKAVLVEDLSDFEAHIEIELFVYDSLIHLGIKYLNELLNMDHLLLEASTNQFDYWILELIAKILNRICIRIYKAKGDRVRPEDLLQFADGITTLNFYDPNSLSVEYKLINDHFDSYRYTKLKRAKTIAMKIVNFIAKYKAKALEPGLSNRMTRYSKTLDVFLIDNNNKHTIQNIKKLLCEYLDFFNIVSTNIAVYHTTDFIKNVLLLKIIRKLVAASMETDNEILEYAIALDQIFDMHNESELMSKSFRLYFNLTQVLEGYLVQSVELLVLDIMQIIDQYNETKAEQLVSTIQTDLLILASVAESNKFTASVFRNVYELIFGIMKMILESPKVSPYIILAHAMLCRRYILQMFSKQFTTYIIQIEFIMKHFDFIFLCLTHEDNGIKHAGQENFKTIFEISDEYNIQDLTDNLANEANKVFENLIRIICLGKSSYVIDCCINLLMNKNIKLGQEYVVQGAQCITSCAFSISDNDVETFINLTNLNKYLLTYTSFSIEAVECIDQSQYKYYMLAFESTNKDLIENAILELLIKYVEHHKYCSTVICSLVNYAMRRMDTIDENHLFKFIYTIIKYSSKNIRLDHFNSILTVILIKFNDVRAIYTCHLLLATYHTLLTEEIGQSILKATKSQFIKTTNIKLKAGLIIVELIVSMYCNSIIISDEENFNQVKEHVDDNVVIKNIFFTTYERRGLVVCMLHFISLIRCVQAYSTNIHTVLIVIINHLQFIESQTHSIGISAKKTSANFCKKTNVQLDSFDSECMESDNESSTPRVLVSHKRPTNIRHFENCEIFPEPFIVFKDYIKHLKLNLESYNEIISRMPLQYSNYIKQIHGFEAVIVDKEKGITEKRRIVRLKPKTNN